MKIIEDKENSLLNRREVKVVTEAEKNPSFSDAENLISEKFKADKELIVIKNIKGKFGRNTFLITSFIYKNKEDKENTEPKKKEKPGQEQPQEQTQPTQQIEKKEEKPEQPVEEKK